MYVDKTLLLKSIFDHKHLLITVPRGFLKSTNLNMVKVFLSANQMYSASDRYKIFDSLNIYKKERDFFNQHFGKYPVLNIDMSVKYQTVYNYKDALNNLISIISKSCHEHEYLKVSKYLMEKEKSKFKLWFSGKIRFNEIKQVLLEITQLLYKHYSKSKIYVLIDNYESMISEAMFHVENDLNFIKIVDLVVDQLTSLLSSPSVQGSVITGEWGCPGLGSSIKNMSVFTFSGENKIQQFYCFSEDEVEMLINHSSVIQINQTLDKAKLWYGGYNSVSSNIMFNPYSVLGFLETMKFRRYWKISSYFRYFAKLFEIEPLRSQAKLLIQLKPIQVSLDSCSDLIDLKHLRAALLKNKFTLLNCNIVFSHLLQLGYLSLTNKLHVGNKVDIKIPNMEIWHCIQHILL